jgi:hypothetical protein
MARVTAEPDEGRLANARQSRRQDTQIPFLINTDDARLVPNTKLTRTNRKYIPYLGKVSDDKETRFAFLKHGNRRRVVDTSAQEEVFDVGTADAQQLVAFALDEFGAMLSEDTPIRKLRREVMQLAEVAGNAAPTAVAPPKPTGVKAALTIPSTDDIAG